MNPNVSPNLKLVTDLETILQQLIADHRKLLKHIEAQHAAMRIVNVRAMDDATNQQEACRLRIAAGEQRRRALVSQIAKSQRITGEPKIPQLAQMFPQRKEALWKLREELRGVIGQIGSKNHIAGKLAGAILGHLNTAVRLLAGAVEHHAGIYTKRGVPKMSARIGVMEAVG